MCVVCLCVCVLVAIVIPSKTTEPVQIRFGLHVPKVPCIKWRCTLVSQSIDLCYGGDADCRYHYCSIAY